MIILYYIIYDLLNFPLDIRGDIKASATIKMNKCHVMVTEDGIKYVIIIL